MADTTPTFSPGIFEVDLIFPRNETYAPHTLLPVVFALQNPPLAFPVAAWISWSLWEGNNLTSPGSITDGVIELALLNLTSTEPLLVTRFIDTIPYPNGFWTFEWSLQMDMCSAGYGPGQFIDTNSTTVFTISQSGQAPDLVAATSSDKCGTMKAYAYNITAEGESCGYFGPSPTTNPCAVTVNAAAASSVMAAGTALACDPLESSIYPNVTCPPVSVSSSNVAGQYHMAAAPTLLTLLAVVSGLIHLG
ncbi:uncharacterized protein BO80DRAFT_426578 [Aspergillus ibericus CBS 121593]|uniref:DUF7136 domain-containing protein n=1 Tax=Aspergillus ibericus CBS 121593 TaxID=1448316 RepID=A0A395GUQ6_9EURO|nr:hypothetical protein BO80DRAFT_426578 [Aspergillus ibericus CBS 121593]RAK99290.1 hypothetical protein BO80DRAFT_426578 [Aspergillus ibericus CBS 121593]